MVKLTSAEYISLMMKKNVETKRTESKLGIRTQVYKIIILGGLQTVEQNRPTGPNAVRERE